MIPEKMTGTTVTDCFGNRHNHPDANVFDTDDKNNLILLTNSDDDGLVAMYRADQWTCVVSHGTHPAVDE